MLSLNGLDIVINFDQEDPNKVLIGHEYNGYIISIGIDKYDFASYCNGDIPLNELKLDSDQRHFLAEGLTGKLE